MRGWRGSSRAENLAAEAAPFGEHTGGLGSRRTVNLLFRGLLSTEIWRFKSDALKRVTEDEM
ncbi:MAG: hypothetical protein N3B10_06020 [Armatimonadetes bacterium]|nr:hypothetical protein [Armatimonadota bacterium]MCX7968034.1 hypothetical protein [Armatimonadota bacterium]MDW8143386.1 hypothetical protein [Armatimonadota bacterium]